MIWLTNLLEKPAGKAAAIVLFLGGIVIAGYIVKTTFMTSAVSLTRHRYFIDSSTGEPFAHELQRGEGIPIDAPSGGKTGYPAELCFWTKDGQPKGDPTPVLLNSWVGKTGPTFCPDCGRLVVSNNPPARPGARPPITRQEYEHLHQTGLGPELLHSIALGN
jgi:hypothetical protein